MEASWNCTLFDQRTFSCHSPHLIYVVRGSETCDVEGPTSIIQKVTIVMFSGRTLNGPDCFETWFVGG